jgi:hypothetical protein
MTAQWFCQIAGAEVGPLSSQQVKMMVVNGRLLPSDSIRQGASGPWYPASRVKGLFPPGQAGAGAAAAAGSPARKNGQALPVARKTQHGAGAANGGKKAAGGQAGAVHPARAIAAPAAQPKQPGQAAHKSPLDDEFPEELVGGIPGPKKGFNFDKFAIDMTPVKVTGRKSSRVGGMSKARYTKMTRIMAAAIGGAFLLCVALITISLLNSGKPRPSPDSGAQTAEGQPTDVAAARPDESKSSEAAADKPAHGGTAAADKTATKSAKGGKADAGSKVAASPKGRPATKSPAADTSSGATAKADARAAGKAAGKPAADPNRPVGPNDPVPPLSNLPPD